MIDKNKNMNNEIVEFLEMHKKEYTQESLTQQLQNAGHDPQEIQACIAYVFGTQTVSLSEDEKPKKKNGILRFFGL